MIQTVSQKTTLAEFLAMPETKPANELIGGAIYQKPMPQGKHSIIQRELTFTIDRPLRDRKIARAFPELRCTFGDRSTVPDIAVMLWERIPATLMAPLQMFLQLPPIGRLKSYRQSKGKPR